MPRYDGIFTIEGGWSAEAETAEEAEEITREILREFCNWLNRIDTPADEIMNGVQLADVTMTGANE